MAHNNLINQIDQFYKTSMIDVPDIILNDLLEKSKKRVNFKLNQLISIENQLDPELNLKKFPDSSATSLNYIIKSKDALGNWKYKDLWDNSFSVMLNVQFLGLIKPNHLDVPGDYTEFKKDDNVYHAKIQINMDTITNNFINHPGIAYAKINAILHHELVHFSQNLLYEMKNHNKQNEENTIRFYGSPEKGLMNTPKYFNEENYSSHSIENVEFYPNLINEKATFEYFNDKKNPTKDLKLTKENFKNFVGLEPSKFESKHFSNLKKHNYDKYKKAVKELFKMLNLNQEQ